MYLSLLLSSSLNLSSSALSLHSSLLFSSISLSILSSSYLCFFFHVLYSFSFFLSSFLFHVPLFFLFYCSLFLFNVPLSSSLLLFIFSLPCDSLFSLLLYFSFLFLVPISPFPLLSLHCSSTSLSLLPSDFFFISSSYVSSPLHFFLIHSSPLFKFTLSFDFVWESDYSLLFLFGKVTVLCSLCFGK